MKIVFAGTPGFAATALKAILAARHDVACVLAQPDRPAGRGRQVRAGPVKSLAAQHGLRLLQPASLTDPRAIASIGAEEADAVVVAAYGLILPKAILNQPRLGCVNIHASLLPRWRGAAPIQRALLAGDTVTGITIMRMDEGLDTGPILMQESLTIARDDTAGTLHDRLAALGARLIVEALAFPREPRPQDPARATYARKIEPREGEIDWCADAVVIDRQVRALNPSPGAFTYLDGTLLKIWRVAVERGPGGAPGEVSAASANGIVVACGTGAVRVLELQRAGGRLMPPGAFLAGHQVARGTALGR